MIFQQLFDPESSTYTYLLAARKGGEALIIDPVLGQVQVYLERMEQLELELVKAVDTHVHADHITGLGELRDRTRCITVMGEHSPADVVSMRVREGDTIDVDGISLGVIYTPGHTIDSYSFVMPGRVFTGDTLLIRGTGRTDFQSGDARAQYDSLFNKLLKLPDPTLVYPAHDYKGETVSTVGDEKLSNPRLQVKGIEEYAALMENLNLPNPRMMDVAVPANIAIGLAQARDLEPGQVLTAEAAAKHLNDGAYLFVDLRERREREQHGVIPGSLHAPYPHLRAQLDPENPLHLPELASGRRLLFYCAYGERSALALRTAAEARIDGAAHVIGGINAWKQAKLPIEDASTHR